MTATIHVLKPSPPERRLIDAMGWRPVSTIGESKDETILLLCRNGSVLIGPPSFEYLAGPSAVRDPGQDPGWYIDWWMPLPKKPVYEEVL